MKQNALKSATAVMTYNSNQEAYQITTTGNTETFIPINSLDGLNNLVIEYDVYNQGNASVGFARVSIPIWSDFKLRTI